MIDYKQQLSDLESLASAVDYDMSEYDEDMVNDLAKRVKDMRALIIDLFGVEHFVLTDIINRANQVSDTDRDEWEGNNL